MKYFVPFVFLLFSSCLSFSQTVAEEYHLKAAFLFHFTRFFEWEAFNDHEFVIGILGSSPIYKPLQEISKTKTVNEKKILIKKFDSLSEIGFCNILFISANFSAPIDEVLTKANAKGTLLVSEKPGYAAHGTCINFVIVNKKLKFEVNTKAMENAGFKASSQLLKLAIIVD